MIWLDVECEPSRVREHSWRNPILIEFGEIDEIDNIGPIASIAQLNQGRLGNKTLSLHEHGCDPTRKIALDIYAS